MYNLSKNNDIYESLVKARNIISIQNEYGCDIKVCNNTTSFNTHDDDDDDVLGTVAFLQHQRE